MVSKRERLEAAIAGQIADRIPVALWRHFPVDDQSPVELARSTAQFQEMYDFDFVKVTPSSSFCLRDWGVEDRWSGHTEGTREYTKRVVSDSQGWEKLNMLDPKHGALGGQLKCLAELRSALGNEVPIIQTIFSPLAQAKNLSGQAALMMHINQDPTSVLAGLETIAVSTEAFVSELKSAGVDGIFYAVQHASYKYFDDVSYDRFGRPYDLRILETAQDLWLNVLHLHGEAIMFNLASRLPVQVVNWHDREVEPSLRDGAAMLNCAVCGGVKRETLELGTPEAVRDEALEALTSMQRKGLVLGTGCVTPILTPRSNIEALRDSVNFA